jgi:hypothetical protein
MNTQSDDRSTLRTGARRAIPRREFRHLRAWGSARIGGGVVLTACSVLTLSFGGSEAKTYRWASAFLVLAALNFAGGFWELTIARSASARD